jgi:hypothetical protein
LRLKKSRGAAGRVGIAPAAEFGRSGVRRVASQRSSDSAPLPLIATTADRPMASRWYSKPSEPAGSDPNQFMKKPSATCVLAAPTMIPKMPSEASRPPSPTTSAIGATSSVTIASAASGAGKPNVPVIQSSVPENP